ncbi:MAG: 4a-hydroxytetrahydrobiopterin dehydratase, partial [Acidimicrobiales bacterium]
AYSSARQALMAVTLTEDEALARLQEVPGWTIEDEKLHREFHFKDFGEAFGFMTRVALAAEKLDHHPDWSNSWNKVVIDIISHADGGITDQCFELAVRINQAKGEG